MDKISFDAGLTVYDVKSIQPVASNVLQIIYADEMPDDESVYSLDIMLFTSDMIVETTLKGWTTIYYQDGQTVYLSNDGSVYTEPDTTEPEPQEEPEPYEPTVEELQTAKISTMQATCASYIKAGTDVNGEHFSLDNDTRLDLMARQHRIDSGEDEIDFYPDGEPSKYYSAEEMQNIIDTANNFINGHEVYCNELCLWIETLTDKEEIEAVYYGMDIPEERRSSVLSDLIFHSKDELHDEEDDKPGDDDDDGEDPDDDSDEDDSDDKNAGGRMDLGGDD